MAMGDSLLRGLFGKQFEGNLSLERVRRDRCQFTTKRNVEGQVLLVTVFQFCHRSLRFMPTVHKVLIFSDQVLTRT